MISKTLWTIFFTLFTLCYADIDLSIVTDAERIADGIVITLKERFQLTCNVTTTSNESSAIEIEWLLNNKPVKASERIKIFGDNNTLVVKNAGESDCGLYVCRPNITDKDVNDTLLVQSKPYVHSSFKESSMNKIEGERLKLNCTAEGVPKPELHWLQNGGHIRELNDSRFSIEGTQNESALIVVDLEQTDEGNYTCVANSTTGFVSASININVKDKLAALWPFLGIVVEVTILCIIIFIYEKRRAKQEEEESDTDQNPETKNMNEKDNVRQRK